MRALPLFKYGPRARSTSWAIALCAMFIVASFSVVSGLRVSMDVLSDNFQPEFFLLTVQGASGPEFFSSSAEVFSGVDAAFGTVISAAVAGTGGTVMVCSVHDPDHVLPETIAADGADALAGVSTNLTGALQLESEGSAEVTVVGTYSSVMFPTTWLFVNGSVTSALSDTSAGMCNFGITGRLTESQATALSDGGYSVQSMIGVLDFLDSGVNEIEEDTYWILVPSSFVIAVLAYSFMGSEISDRRHDIGIVKAVGAGRKQILGMLLAEAAAISLWGSLLGLALGIVLAYGVSTVASAAFTSVFVVEIQESVLLLSVIITVASAVVGALLPAVRMTVTRPVEDLKEVMPSS